MKLFNQMSKIPSSKISILQIVQQGLMSQADYDEASRKALSLFEYGQVIYLNSLLAERFFK